MISTIAAMTVANGARTAMSFEGATNTEAFVLFVEQVLLPMLRAGQVVVLDNLSAHKSAEVDRLIESFPLALDQSSHRRLLDPSALLSPPRRPVSTLDCARVSRYR